MAEKHLIHVDEWAFEVEFERLGDGDGEGATRLRLDPEGAWRTVELHRVRAGLHVLMIDNRPLELYLERRRGGVDVTIGRRTYHVQIGRGRRATRAPSHAAADRDGLVRIAAPMTGSVLEVRTEHGAEVAQGDVLVVLESMKMNNELRSPVAGTVERLQLTVDAQVEEGAELVAIRPTERQTEA